MSTESPCHTIAAFNASDGYVWRYRRFDPPGEPRGTLVCLHGIQSHGGWYEYSCTKLAAAGFRVFFLDRRGSGLNEMARGDAPSFQRLLDDIAEFLLGPAIFTPGSKGTLPTFLVAVSWGGKLAVALQRRQPGLVNGLVLLCPGFFPQVGLPLLKRLRILAGRLTAPTSLYAIPLNDANLFTASLQWREFIRTDPLALHQATARFLFDSVRLDRYVRAAPRHMNIPTLLLLAGQDRIIRNDRTQRYFQKFSTTDKNVITYAQAHHTLEFEPDPDRFLAEMIRWLDRHCILQTPGADS